MKPIRLLIVDDHVLMHAVVRSVLESAQDILVVGAALTVEETWEAVEACRPDVILLDILMPGLSGIEAMRRLLYEGNTRILILTAQDHLNFAAQLMEFGAHGYLPKGVAAKELVSAIRTVARGDRYLPDVVAQHLVIQKTGENTNPLSGLSMRSMEVFIAVAQGKAPALIAKQLSVSIKTIHGYRYELQKKFNVSTDVELAAIAIQQGLVVGSANE